MFCIHVHGFFFTCLQSTEGIDPFHFFKDAHNLKLITYEFYYTEFRFLFFFFPSILLPEFIIINYLN